MAITAAAGGGNWNTNGAWVGSVQPTAADDVLLTASSGNITIPTSVTALCRSIDCTGYVGTLTFANSSSVLSIGDGSGGALKFVNTMTLTLTGNGTINFLSTSTNGGTGWGVTTGSRTMPNVTFNGSGGKWVLQDACSVASGQNVTLTQGTLDTNGQTVTCNVFDINSSSTRTLTLGSSSLSLLSGGSAFTGTTVTGLTVTANTATASLSTAGGTWNTSGFNWNGLSVVFSGSGTSLYAGGVSTFANMTRTGTASKTDVFQLSANVTLTGTFTVNGNSATNRVLVSSNTIGTARTINAAVVTVTNANFRDITGAGAGSWNLSAIAGNSGNCGGNSGITFTTAAPQTHTTSSGGSWSDITKWTSRVPLPQDDVIVDANTTSTMTVDMPMMGKSIDFTGFAGTLSLSVDTEVFGSFTLSGGLAWSAALTVTLSGRGSFTLTTFGKRVGNLVFSAVGGTYTALDNIDLGAGSTFTLSDGTLDFGTFRHSATAFSSSSGRTRNLLIAGVVTLAQVSGFPWLLSGAGLSATITGTIQFQGVSTSATTRNFATTALAYNVLRFDTTPDLVAITGGPTYNVVMYSAADAFTPTRGLRPALFKPGNAR